MGVSDGPVSEVTGPIIVAPAGIDSFTLNAPPTVNAGVPFILSVLGAVDAFGNNANGTIAIDFTDGAAAHNAPDGTSPSLVNITVVNGSGNVAQPLVLAESLTSGVNALTGQDTVTPATADSGDITVLPGGLDHFTVVGEPATTMAGIDFDTANGSPGNDITVTAYDQYNNVKTDYVGTITFTTTDPGAAPPVVLPANYTFVAGDLGVRDFAWTGFTLVTAGNQTVGVSDGPANGATGVILVIAAGINTFTLTAPANVTTGAPFSLDVTNAQDLLGNPASGTIQVSFTDAGLHQAPDGTNPTLVDITVVNGLGSAIQTLVLAEGPVANMFTGTDSVTPATATSGAMTVAPGALDHFVFTTQPAPVEKVLTNITIALDALDIFDNISNFAGAATISDDTGTIYESAGGPGDTTINFAAGQYSGDVVVQLPISNNRIEVTSGAISVNSSVFDVIPNNVIVRLDNDTAPKVALAGERIAMFDIEMENPDTTGQDLNLSSMEFFIENSKNGQAITAVPASLISNIEIYDITAGPEVFVGQNTTPNTTPQPIAVNTPVMIPASPPAPSATVLLRVYVTLRTDLSQADVANIQLRIADVIGTFVGPPPAPASPTNDSFESIKLPENYIRSGVTNIKEEAAKAAFNYSNPFNPRRQSTTISFYNTGTKATVKIYTITGKLVRDLTKDTPQTSGSVEVQWDGKNGRGQVVRNGVYVAVITADGTRMMVKIAVVK